ncbi:MAG: response regulator [Thermodesulfobacteriota bacterium]|nr:response regulator [Thermodesulfobacteriota bacterium]
MNNLKILVVDDDPATVSLLERRLKNAGYEIETADNGAEAVRLISKCHFDVVLTDLMMPGGLDGMGVLEAARQMSNRTEVILITAYASVDNAVEAMKKGATDYLQKPVNCDELLLRLEKISNLKTLIRDAGDLREAMDITEANAAQTIQNLEMEVARLQKKLSEIRKIVSE